MAAAYREDWFAETDLLIRHYIGDAAADTEDWDLWAVHAARARGRRHLEIESMRRAVHKGIADAFPRR